jgi:hypothetical protein
MPCELTHSRSYRSPPAVQAGPELGARFGVAMSTMRALLVAVGCASRPVGWPKRLQPEPAGPEPRPAVEIVPDVGGKLRIPMRTAEERRRHAWTAPDLQAIAVELRAGRAAGATWRVRITGAGGWREQRARAMAQFHGQRAA